MRCIRSASSVHGGNDWSHFTDCLFYSWSITAACFQYRKQYNASEVVVISTEEISIWIIFLRFLLRYKWLLRIWFLIEAYELQLVVFKMVRWVISFLAQLPRGLKPWRRARVGWQWSIFEQSLFKVGQICLEDDWKAYFFKRKQYEEALLT